MSQVHAWPSTVPGDRAGPTVPAVSGIKASILETIGRTPIVRLNNIGPSHAALYAKLEAFNPMGSVKDRLALAVIEAAERANALRPGQTVIEATSGNTGIGLAMVCAHKGYPLVIVMAESFSIERRKLLRFLGAKVVLTPASERGTGMFALAERLAKAHGWFFCRQFENEANADVHSATTAREILNDFEGIGLDAFVSGFGTGGTLKGVARVLKAESPLTDVVVAEPENSQILASAIRQARRPDGAAARSHPDARAHPVQGWSPDFVPKLAGDANDEGLIDRFQPVSGRDAIQVARDLALKEGIFCGISGGATVAAAIRIAETAPQGASILAMVPDTGERYLSTPLFDDMPVDMSDAEHAIASSVPPIRRKTAGRGGFPNDDVPPEAVAFVEHAIQSHHEPIVMFGFEWCEFCWSVRTLFRRAGIPMRTIDLDTAEYRSEDRGGRILRAVFATTGVRTVPQVFLGAEYLGGATDVLTAFDDRSLHQRLARLNPPMVPGPVDNAIDLLPAWVRRPNRPSRPRSDGVRA